MIGNIDILVKNSADYLGWVEFKHNNCEPNNWFIEVFSLV